MTRRIQPGGDTAEVQLSVGEVLEVLLPAQTGGGYQWMAEPFAAGVVESAGSSYAAAGTGLGSDQRQSLWFRATARGEAHIDLRYGRAWEGEGGVQRRCRLKLVVR